MVDFDSCSVFLFYPTHDSFNNIEGIFLESIFNFSPKKKRLKVTFLIDLTLKIAVRAFIFENYIFKVSTS